MGTLTMQWKMNRPGPEQRQSKPPVTSSDKALADVHMRSLQAFFGRARGKQSVAFKIRARRPSMLHTKEHLSVAHSGTETHSLLSTNLIRYGALQKLQITVQEQDLEHEGLN